MYTMQQKQFPLTQKTKSSTNLTGIPTQMKRDFEGRNGLSFDDVRVRYRSDKPAKVGAVACIQGARIDIASGYESALPHELGHYPQQALGLTKATCSINGMPVDASPERERDANRRIKAVQTTAKVGVKAALPRLNTAQQPIQRLTEAEFEKLCHVYCNKYILSPHEEEEEDGMEEEEREAEALSRAAEECNEALNEYSAVMHPELTADGYISKVRYEDAFKIVRAWYKKTYEQPRHTVVTFGDQGWATGRRAQKSGFRVIATALMLNEDDPATVRRREKIERATVLDPETTVELYAPIELGDNGQVYHSETNEPFVLPDTFDRRFAIVAFDHPFTTGRSSTKGGPDSDVKRLCNNLFDFARIKKFGRVQITVRAVNAANRKMLYPYELTHEGFHLYKIQRSQAKKHLHTNPDSKDGSIDPQEQALVLKYVNMNVMFPKLLDSMYNVTNMHYRGTREDCTMLDSFRAALRQAYESKWAPLFIKRLPLTPSQEQWIKGPIVAPKHEVDLNVIYCIFASLAEMLQKQYWLVKNEQEFFSASGEQIMESFPPHDYDEEFSE